MLTALILASTLQINLVEQHVVQDGSSWVIYLKLQSKEAEFIMPRDMAIAIESNVQNTSAGEYHSHPRKSNPSTNGMIISGYEVVKNVDDAKKCEEKMMVFIGDKPIEIDDQYFTEFEEQKNRPLNAISPKKDDFIYVIIKLYHNHFLYGPYHPLLGKRDITVKLNKNVVKTSIDLNRERYKVQAKTGWPNPPEDRRDTRYFISAPDSLHSEAHIQGNQRYRFPETLVRYNTKMKLSFYYLIAPGGDPSGEFRVRIAQYKDSPSGWMVLHDSGTEQTYDIVGKWAKVEKIIKIREDATSYALEFLIYGADVGEVWIDDVKFEPVNSSNKDNP